MIKKNIYAIPVIVLMCIYLYACGSSSIDTTSKKLKKGTYDFIIMDSLSKPMIEGVADIDTSGPDIFGSYQIVKAEDTTFAGYSSLRGGEFKGQYNKAAGEIYMNMNPRIADANVYITAKITGDILRGNWSFSTFRGSMTGGKFKATKE